MFGNFFFVFGSLVEFALVHSSVQRKVRKNKRKQLDEQKSKNNIIINNKDYRTCEMGDLEDGKNDVENSDTKRARFRATRAKTQLELKLKQRNLDYYALIIFPTAFVIWHACFAAYCLVKLDHTYFWNFSANWMWIIQVVKWPWNYIWTYFVLPPPPPPGVVYDLWENYKRKTLYKNFMET